MTGFESCSLCPNSLCYNIGRNISCECPFSEDRCLTLTSPNVCTRNCVTGSCNQSICICYPGYTGQYCDIQLCGDQVCDNQSTCVITNGTCQCPPGSMGRFCEEGTYVAVDGILCTYLSASLYHCWNVARSLLICIFALHT